MKNGMNPVKFSKRKPPASWMVFCRGRWDHSKSHSLLSTSIKVRPTLSHTAVWGSVKIGTSAKRFLFFPVLISLAWEPTRFPTKTGTLANLLSFSWGSLRHFDHGFDGPCNSFCSGSEMKQRSGKPKMERGKTSLIKHTVLG